jgi:AAA family ATP:ADP antiporter
MIDRIIYNCPVKNDRMFRYRVTEAKLSTTSVRLTTQSKQRASTLSYFNNKCLSSKQNQLNQLSYNKNNKKQYQKNTIIIYNSASSEHDIETFKKDMMGKKETVKHVILGSMFFCNLGVYTLIRDLKDVMLVTACGAESIPFMKTWVNFPLSISFMMFFTKMCHGNIKQQNIYRIIYFTVFGTYMILGYVLYPNRELLSPSLNISSLYIHKSLILIINNWISALFYALSTIWGSTIVTLLFWLTANNYVKKDNATVVYPLFGVLSNFSLIICGTITKYLSNLHRLDWNMTVQSMMMVIFVFGMLNALLYEILVRNYEMINMKEYKPKTNNDISFIEGLKNMISTPFVFYMVVLLACYGSAGNLIDTVWKYNIREYYQNPSDYSKFMGTLSSSKGIVSIVTMVVSSFTLKRIPYKITVMITPILLSSMGLIFFVLNLNNPNPYIIALFGSLIQIMVKSVKYAFFDPNKEIAFMSMSDEIKTKGKATIDLLSNSLGKSGISLFLQLMIVFVGSIVEIIPYLLIVFFLISTVWIRSAYKIGDIVSKT